MADRSAPARVAHSHRRSERGETLVEFALAALLFMVTIFGTLDLGWTVWQYNMVSNLAQEGARYAAVHGLTSGSPKTEAQVATWVQGRTAGMGGVTVTTTPSSGPAVRSSIWAVRWPSLCRSRRRRRCCGGIARGR